MNMAAAISNQTLTFGQKKAGLTLSKTKSNKFDTVMKVRIFYANIFDALYQDIEEADNYEQERLARIAIDENVVAMNATIRSLTFGHD